MRCPYCGADDTQVKDSRPADEMTAIRRRRACAACGGRFTTFERVQMREMTVAKQDGRREPFDRAKLERSMRTALRKREVSPERVEAAVSGVVRRLEAGGDGDVSSREIGRLVMDALKGLDGVAYIRFASVYRDFREARDFEAVLDEVAERTSARPGAARPEDG